MESWVFFFAICVIRVSVFAHYFDVLFAFNFYAAQLLYYWKHLANLIIRIAARHNLCVNFHAKSNYESASHTSNK